jgi:elongation factor 1-gamma
MYAGCPYICSSSFSLQTLYTYPENFRAYKALIAAQYAGGNVKIAPGFVFGETNKNDTFLKKFPLGKVM